MPCICQKATLHIVYSFSLDYVYAMWQYKVPDIKKTQSKVIWED